MKTVVGAALIRGGRVLAARRTAPPEAAGRWEFPGGKVEPGESIDEALVREIAEELGVVIEIDRWLAAEALIGQTHLLRVATAFLAEEADPEPVDHDELRWLTRVELDSVDWLEPDRPFLDELRELLS